MATARPGWSRRAQYGLFFSFIAAIAGLVVGLILLALSLVAPKSYAAVRGAALDATAPDHRRPACGHCDRGRARSAAPATIGTRPTRMPS